MILPELCMFWVVDIFIEGKIVLHIKEINYVGSMELGCFGDL